MNAAEHIEKARHLTSLYERGQLTEGALVNGILWLVSPDNIVDVIAVLPPDIREEVRRWAKAGQREKTESLFWPLPEATRLSLKEWLRQEETNGR